MPYEVSELELDVLYSNESILDIFRINKLPEISTHHVHFQPFGLKNLPFVITFCMFKRWRIRKQVKGKEELLKVVFFVKYRN